MRVGIVGTGAFAWKHAQAYRNIGYQVVACTNRTADRGQNFADANGAEFMETAEKLTQSPKVDFVDVCSLPNYRLPVVELCARNGKHVLVQKPMAIDLATARQMIVLARDAGIELGVVSQRRFRQIDVISQAGDSRRTAGKNPAGRRLCEVAPLQ